MGSAWDVSGGVCETLRGKRSLCQFIMAPLGALRDPSGQQRKSSKLGQETSLLQTFVNYSTEGPISRLFFHLFFPSGDEWEREYFSTELRSEDSCRPPTPVSKFCLATWFGAGKFTSRGVFIGKVIPASGVIIFKVPGVEKRRLYPVMSTIH